jgi:hypothetical protein
VEEAGEGEEGGGDAPERDGVAVEEEARGKPKTAEVGGWRIYES